MELTEPELVYRGLDRCDLCGARLTPSEQLAGLCHACRWPEKPRSRRAQITQKGHHDVRQDAHDTDAH